MGLSLYPHSLKLHNNVHSSEREHMWEQSNVFGHKITESLSKIWEPYIKYFICKILVNCLRLHCSFVPTPIIPYFLFFFFDLLNFLLTSISLSNDEI